MAFSNLNDPSAALRLCVDSAEQGRLSGLVYSQRLTEPLPFSDVGSLLLKLDGVLEKQKFPQAFQQARSFTGKEDDVPAASDPSEGMSAEAVAGAAGRLATLCVHVMSRRNASWQGWVDAPDGGRQEFSSALELVRLIEERMA